MSIGGSGDNRHEGRSEASKHKEVLFRCIAHNIRRLMDREYSL
jgi:hypothetical protein